MSSLTLPSLARWRRHGHDTSGECLSQLLSLVYEQAIEYKGTVLVYKQAIKHKGNRARHNTVQNTTKLQKYYVLVFAL